MRSRRSRRRTAGNRGRLLRSRRRAARSGMPRDADIHPGGGGPPPAERAPQERGGQAPPGGALVPHHALPRYLAEIRRIRAYIIRYMMNNWRLVKVGTTQAQRKLFFNLAKERERLEREGFSATPKLLAERLDVREREVVEMEQRLAARDVSVDAPLGEEE